MDNFCIYFGFTLDLYDNQISVYDEMKKKKRRQDIEKMHINIIYLQIRMDLIFFLKEWLEMQEIEEKSHWKFHTNLNI